MRALVVILLLWVASPASAQLFSPGPLSKAHAELRGDGKCQSCHASGSQVAEPRCLDCHTDIRTQQQKGLGLHGTKFKDKRCATCHVEHLAETSPLIRWPGPDPKRFDHSQTGWPLRGEHAQTACRDCHKQKNERNAPTFLGADRRCGSCHEDPHEKRFGERCSDCHEETSFKRLDLGDFNHSLARFALDGAHTRVECASCHGKPPVYTKLDFADCKSCHEDPHRGEYEPACKTCHVTDRWDKLGMKRDQHPVLSLSGGHKDATCTTCHDAGLTTAPSKGKACVSCHQPVHEAAFGDKCEQCHENIRWSNLPDAIGRKAHAQTPFALKGAHTQVACAECHLPEMSNDKRFRGLAFERCSDCHADAHRGTLKQYGDCSSCHDPAGFAPSRVDPQVHARFGMNLEGGHAATPCSACHAQTKTPRVAWQKDKTPCADCHQNPHGSQFAQEIASEGCGHCHSPVGWGLSRFVHDAWPLTGAHVTAACSACHQPNEADRKAGTGASYRGAPRNCEGCHDDEHAGQFRTSEPVRGCDDCHQTEQFALPMFDHAARARYPLEGKHAQTDCADCHPSVKLASGDEVTRYRLGFQACSDCHADPHAIVPPRFFR